MSANLAGRDVLESGVRRRRWSWLLVLVLVVASALWLERGRGADSVDRPLPAAEQTGWVAYAPPDRAGPARDWVEQLTYVDDRTGFLVQHLCPPRPEEPCPRRVAATTDGGRSWQPRGRLPDEAQLPQTLVALSATDLALYNEYLPSTITYSGDGGRNWSVSALARGEPGPAPAGAPLIVDATVPCPATVCLPWLAWVDIAEQRVHRLPGQPAAEAGSALVAASRGPAGELVATALKPAAAAWVWTSRDGGRTFVGAALPVPTASGQGILGVRAYAAGGDRVFAFADVATGSLMRITGFRSDDGGRTWTSLGAREERRGWPTGVLAGELIGTDAGGLIQLSHGRGQGWRPSGVQVGSGWVTQQRPGGPVLATVVDASRLVTYYQSSDGRAWARVVPPEAT